MAETNQHITISAAGKATRIRDWMCEQGFPEGTPKSALPTGAGETLLGRIVRQAMPIGHPQIFGNYDTMRGLGEIEDLPRDVTLVVNRNITGPLGPIYLDTLRTEKQSYMAAGDFWADFSWQDFVDFHNDHDKLASILVAPSVPTMQGARFNVQADGSVQSWERVERTTNSDLINIGCYIMDGQDEGMREVISRLNPKTHKEDPFNDAMIAIDSLAAFVLNGPAFNANNSSVYQAMVKYSSTMPCVSEPVNPRPIKFAQGAP
jgi:NDP-sugar pyrophosphorylase family protein